jgi:predicted RNA binding protein YcfA (HicA-like mRNA interferase family)
MGFTVTVAELIAFLAAQGFRRETTGGRHGVKMVKGRLRVPIPAHKRDMAKGTANHVLLQSGFTADDVIRWRNKA